ncbi:MAG TPA: GntR family transcriptional regulator [Candidatus Anaerostipes excrementavium]|uniref:GntR family transcriptional regulator n=1 Tax=Candidatus Anaerostipes excrementavium TaxID=2838463 RepID=A0A9D2BAP7_9FIRM|nr:GntR family transcriptional regulator [uncultured Anaerostipes sp.]HIX68487.1 GntR family transcriptional regulator [Candidatus Anaerostipes excrementavium]
MKIIISNTKGQPIYEQIYRQMKDMIIAGKLKEGDMLPSIRGLAKDLRISVITTKRAYDELEKDGFINSVAGKGSFVAEKNLELIREENLKKIENYMERIWELAKVCGISADEVIEMFQIMGKEVEE